MKNMGLPLWLYIRLHQILVIFINNKLINHL